MGYTPTTWVNGQTALSAANMNNIESGVNTAIKSIEASNPNVVIGTQDYDPAACTFRWGDEDFYTKWFNAVSVASTTTQHIHFLKGTYSFTPGNLQNRVLLPITRYAYTTASKGLVISGSGRDETLLNYPNGSDYYDNSFSFFAPYGVTGESFLNRSDKLVVKDLSLDASIYTGGKLCTIIAINGDLTLDNVKIVRSSSFYTGNNCQCDVWCRGSLNINNSRIANEGSITSNSYSQANVVAEQCRNIKITNSVINSLVLCGVTEQSADDLPGYQRQDNYAVEAQTGGVIFQVANNELKYVLNRSRGEICNNIIYGGEVIIDGSNYSDAYNLFTNNFTKYTDYINYGKTVTANNCFISMGMENFTLYGSGHIVDGNFIQSQCDIGSVTSSVIVDNIFRSIPSYPSGANVTFNNNISA